MKRTLVTAVFLLTLLFKGHPQDSVTERNAIITAGTAQVKESANFGLVFTGPELGYGMIWSAKREKSMYYYGCEADLQLLFSKNIPALGFYLKPVDAGFLFRINPSGRKFYLGPVIKSEYQYNLYPDLQSGFDYWFSRTGAGAGLSYNFNINELSFILKANILLLALTSRQPEYRNPYYYDLGAGKAISHLTKDLSFKAFNSFTVTGFEAAVKLKPGSGVMIAYCLNYEGYYESPSIKMIHHNIRLILNRKTGK